MRSLWDWWEGTLTDEQRRGLLALSGTHVPPSLAVPVMKASYPQLVVLPYVDPFEEHGCIRPLTHEVEQFVIDREHEMRHPEAWS